LTFLRIVCGSTAGAVTKTIIAPLERIKILHQTQGMNSQGKKHYSGLWQTFSMVVKEEGFMKLWNGNGANIARVIPNYGLKLALNDVYKNFFQSTTHSKRAVLNHQQLILAGTAAGLTQIAITYPLEVIFTRLAMSGSRSANGIKYNGLIDCVRRSVKSEGFGFMYKGLTPSLLSGSPYVGLQMSSYEMLLRLMPHKEEGSVSVQYKLFAGGLASLFSQTVTFPGDVVRRRMQSDGMQGNTKVYNGMIHCFRHIYQHEGFSAFFAGAKVNIWRCLPEGAIMFATFDFLKQQLDIAKFDQK
jgi:hypothetical protein